MHMDCTFCFIHNRNLTVKTSSRMIPVPKLSFWVSTDSLVGGWVGVGCFVRKRGMPKLDFSLGCAGIQYSRNVFNKLIVVNNCSPEVSSADETQTKTYHINPICQT